MWPSQPTILTDEQGRISRGRFSSREAARGFITGLKSKGKKLQFDEVSVPVQLPALGLQLEIGVDLHRLAVKMSVATAAHMRNTTEIVDSLTREFLLEGVAQSDRVRADFTEHVEIDSMRPPLSHLVFVKGNGSTGRCYAVVQFYGTFQLYVILNDATFTGPDFAVVGTLDPVSLKEKFQSTDLLLVPEARVLINSWEASQGVKRRQERFNAQIKAVLGEQQPDFNLQQEWSPLRPQRKISSRVHHE